MKPPVSDPSQTDASSSNVRDELRQLEKNFDLLLRSKQWIIEDGIFRMPLDALPKGMEEYHALEALSLKGFFGRHGEDNENGPTIDLTEASSEKFGFARMQVGPRKTHEPGYASQQPAPADSALTVKPGSTDAEKVSRGLEAATGIEGDLRILLRLNWTPSEDGGIQIPMYIADKDISIERCRVALEEFNPEFEVRTSDTPPNICIRGAGKEAFQAAQQQLEFDSKQPDAARGLLFKAQCLLRQNSPHLS